MLNTHSCGARWGGAGRCHCAGCHETFSSDSAWTRHRRGLACRDPRDAGLVAVDNPHGGVMWQRPGTWRIQVVTIPQGSSVVVQPKATK